MKHAFSFFFLSIIINLRVAGQDSRPLPIPSLHELVDSAINRDYTLANKLLDIQLTQIDAKKLKDATLPTLEFVAKDAFLLSSFNVNSTDIINIPQLNVNIKTGDNRFTTTGNLLAANAGASVLLYSGGKIPQLKKALKYKADAQRILTEQDKQQITGNIIQAYDQLALLKQVKKVLELSAVRLDGYRKTADKALNYGLSTPYERQKIEVAQAQLASKIQDYEGKLSLVLEQLSLLTHIDKERLLLVDKELVTIAVPMEGGIENRAEVRALEAKQQAQRYQINAARTWFIPKVLASSSLGYTGFMAGHISSSEPLIAGGTTKLSANFPNLNIFPLFNVGIGLKWEIFDGNAGKHEIESARIEYQQTENEKREANEKLELNLAKCKVDYKTAHTQIQLAVTQQQTAQNALTQATKEYRTGLIKSLQLIDAENDFEQAALGYVQSVYNQRRAAAALLMATNSLTVQAVQ